MSGPACSVCRAFATIAPAEAEALRDMGVSRLVTLPEFRSGGHGHLLLEWLFAEAKRLDCEQLHLDSGHHRHGAHRFYLNHGMHIDAHHFKRVLS